MTDKELDEVLRITRQKTLLFHYTRLRLAMLFFQPLDVCNLYIWTLNPKVYDERILIDGALIIYNNDRAKSDAFLRTTINSSKEPSHLRALRNSRTSRSTRSTGSGGTAKKKGSTVGRESSIAQSILHESFQIDAVSY